MRTTSLSLLSLAVWGWALIAPASAQKADAPKQKVVIPFDFESKFDDGDYGKNLGDMIWQKLQRQGGFIIPETEQDVRDWVERNNMLPNPETPLDKMKKIVVDENAGDIGIWGKIERVPPNDTDVYDFWINVVDFSADPPNIIYQKKARTETVSEIPHIYVKEALDKLYERPELVAAGPDAGVESLWKTAPNLVKGDFQTGSTGPVGWDKLPKFITWTRDKSDPANKVLHYQLNEDVAGSTGLFVYSDFFPVDEGALYRFQCRWKSTGSACKVFVKCYSDFSTQYKDKAGKQLAMEKREVYRSQQNLKGPSNTWNTQTEDFTPKHTMYDVKWGRVMLYAYWPAGSVEWDDVVVKQVKPAPKDAKPKDRRPSTETKVRLKDMR